MAREEDIALAEIALKYPAVYDKAVPEYQEMLFKKIAGMLLQPSQVWNQVSEQINE